MTEFFDVLLTCPLFDGLTAGELESLLTCLNGTLRQLEKGSAVFREGDRADRVGVVLTGTVQVVRDDYYGNRSILTILKPGELFGEVFACADTELLPVSVLTLRDSTVLLLDCKRVLNVCSGGCRFHNRLVGNLLQIVAQKNLMLNRKIELLSHKTTREKVMAFLLEQAKQNGSPEFTIPFDRQGLADYLGAERSAMSAVIGKLCREGVIETSGSRFKILP